MTGEALAQRFYVEAVYGPLQADLSSAFVLLCVHTLGQQIIHTFLDPPIRSEEALVS